MLDTTFLIDAERTDGGLDEVIHDDDDVAVSAITVAELRVGVELSRGKARSSRPAFLDDILTSIPLLEYDLAVAEAHAQLLIAVRRQGRPRRAHDLVIAATALASQRVVLTADLTAFDDLPGVDVLHH